MKKLLLLSVILIAGLTVFSQNWSFENWSTTNVTSPDGYYSSVNDWGLLADSTVMPSTDSYTNNFSILLQTRETSYGDTIFGYIMNGDPETMEGGHPVSISNMDSIVGYYKYDIPAGDTALLICVPKYLGAPTGGGIYKITGTQSSWTRFAFAVSAPACDTVVVAAASSNAFLWQGAPGSYIMFDTIQYVSNTFGTIGAVNSDFENWSNIGWDDPDEWTSSNSWALGSSVLPVEQSTDAHSGSFAAQLTTVQHPVYGDTINGMITNGEWSDNGAIGGMPYAYDADGIEFFYKYNPFGTDTAWFSAIFKNSGSYIDMYGTLILPASSYTLWTSPVSLPTTPDSVLIAVGSGNNPGSVLLIDDINITHPVAINENYSIHELIAYPVPAENIINFRFNLKENTNVNIQIINTSGAIVTERSFNKTAGTHRETIVLSELPSGNYLYKIHIGKDSYTKSFIKK